MAGAIFAAVKRKRARLKAAKNGAAPFYTPARYGWGNVARELHPRQTKVKLGPLGGRESFIPEVDVINQFFYFCLS